MSMTNVELLHKFWMTVTRIHLWFIRRFVNRSNSEMLRMLIDDYTDRLPRGAEIRELAKVLDQFLDEGTKTAFEAWDEKPDLDFDQFRFSIAIFFLHFQMERIELSRRDPNHNM